MTIETINVSGGNLVKTVNELIREGNIARISLLHDRNRVLEIPLTSIGDPASPAAVLATPVLAAISAFGALVPDCTIEIERTEGIVAEE
jgi:hypothetical protein